MLSSSYSFSLGMETSSDTTEKTFRKKSSLQWSENNYQGEIGGAKCYPCLRVSLRKKTDIHNLVNLELLSMKSIA